MISFIPWVGKVKTGQTSGGFTVIIPYIYKGGVHVRLKSHLTCHYLYERIEKRKIRSQRKASLPLSQKKREIRAEKEATARTKIQLKQKRKDHVNCLVLMKRKF